MQARAVSKVIIGRMVKAKPIAVFDIDGTIFRSSLLIEILNTLVEKGVFPREVIGEYEPALRAWHNRATKDAYQQYLEQIIASYVQHIKSVTVKQLQIAADSLIERMAGHIYVYTRDLLHDLKKTHFLVAISGSPDEVVQRFAKAYKFDAFYATEYTVVDNVYTGERKTSRFADKHLTVEEALKEHGLSLEGSVGVGDSIGDIGFLQMVERSIAFNPESALFNEAKQQHWEVVVERKDMIYSLKSGLDGRYHLAKTD